MRKLTHILLFLFLPYYIFGQSDTVQGNICMIGSSTTASYAGAHAIAYFMDATGTTTDISVPGHTINLQRAAFQDLSSSVKDDLDYIFCMIGANNLGPSISLETALSDYQQLIDTINSQAENAELILGALTPGRERYIFLYGEVDGEAAYQKYLAINDAVRGIGDNALTGQDNAAYSYNDSLDDGDGNLKAFYDTGDNIHMTDDGKVLLADAYMEVANEDETPSVPLTGTGNKIQVSGGVILYKEN